jgi:hypothetical protein
VKRGSLARVERVHVVTVSCETLPELREPRPLNRAAFERHVGLRETRLHVVQLLPADVLVQPFFAHGVELVQVPQQAQSTYRSVLTDKALGGFGFLHESPFYTRIRPEPVGSAKTGLPTRKSAVALRQRENGLSPWTEAIRAPAGLRIAAPSLSSRTLPT